MCFFSINIGCSVVFSNIIIIYFLYIIMVVLVVLNGRGIQHMYYNDSYVTNSNRFTVQSQVIFPFKCLWCHPMGVCVRPARPDSSNIQMLITAIHEGVTSTPSSPSSPPTHPSSPHPQWFLSLHLRCRKLLCKTGVNC